MHILEYAESSSSPAIQNTVNSLTLSNTEIHGQERKRIGQSRVLDSRHWALGSDQKLFIQKLTRIISVIAAVLFCVSVVTYSASES